MEKIIFSNFVSASYNSASSMSTSQQYTRYNSSTSSYRETNKVVTRGITEQSSYLSGTIDSSASPNLSRKSKTPKNRQTSVIKNQSVDRYVSNKCYPALFSNIHILILELRYSYKITNLCNCIIIWNFRIVLALDLIILPSQIEVLVLPVELHRDYP